MTMSGPTPVSGSSLMIRSPDRIIASRSDVRRIAQAEGRIEPIGDRRRSEREEQRGCDRHERDEAEIAQQEQEADAGAGADPRIAAEGQRERHQHRRHDQRRPERDPAREHDARAAAQATSMIRPEYVM